MRSFFPWMGGKSKMANRLCQLLPHHTCYVEVFSGAANLLFAKEKSKTEVINDINSELVNLFRIVRWHPREFINEFMFMLQSRTEFNDYRSQPGLTDIQRAARSWFVIKTAYGGLGGTSHPSFGYGTVGRAHFRRTVFTPVRLCHKRLDGVYIENLDFADCIKRYDGSYTVFYCDPPYLGAHGYKNAFATREHEKLATILKSIKGKFLLSINKHPKILSLYKSFRKLEVPVTYTVALDKSPQARNWTELLIANYPLPKRW